MVKIFLFGSLALCPPSAPPTLCSTLKAEEKAGGGEKTQVVAQFSHCRRLSPLAAHFWMLAGWKRADPGCTSSIDAVPPHLESSWRHWLLSKYDGSDCANAGCAAIISMVRHCPTFPVGQKFTSAACMASISVVLPSGVSECVGGWQWGKASLCPGVAIEDLLQGAKNKTKLDYRYICFPNSSQKVGKQLHSDCMTALEIFSPSVLLPSQSGFRDDIMFSEQQ